MKNITSKYTTTSTFQNNFTIIICSILSSERMNIIEEVHSLLQTKRLTRGNKNESSQCLLHEKNSGWNLTIYWERNRYVNDQMGRKIWWLWHLSMKIFRYLKLSLINQEVSSCLIDIDSELFECEKTLAICVWLIELPFQYGNSGLHDLWIPFRQYSKKMWLFKCVFINKTRVLREWS